MRAPPERGVVFRCGGEELIGVVHPASAPARVGLLVVVGGPQYRVGSHRQFLLLARHLAAAGIPTMRFDFRGMGDSGGAARGFGAVAEDISAAIDAFRAEVEGVGRVVLWGLCDGATAAGLYAAEDSRIAGLVLLNPWVHTERGSAQAVLRHYYRRRLLQPELWQKILTLRFAWRDSWQSLLRLLHRARTGAAPAAQELPLPERLAAGLAAFAEPVLLVLSGRDLVAAEFRDCVAATPRWQEILARSGVKRLDLPDADHTFSSAVWRDRVAAATLDWIRALPS